MVDAVITTLELRKFGIRRAKGTVLMTQTENHSAWIQIWIYMALSTTGLLLLLIYLLIYLFLAELGLCCCTEAFSSCGEQGVLFVAVRGLLIAVASLVAEHGLQAYGLQ